jgi:sucrose-6-phosphate hydrolase SacC (GH32 family)
MDSGLCATISRRSVLLGTTALLLPKLAWTQADSDLGLHWRLDDTGDDARESVGGKDDPVTSRTGHALWVGKGRERSLRLDGYSVWIEQPGTKPDAGSGPITVCAWLALEAYPVNTAAVLQFGEREAPLCLCIDKWGYPCFGRDAGNGSMQRIASQPVSRYRWIHLAGTISAKDEIAIFVDGAACETSAFKEETKRGNGGASLFIGRSTDSPVIGGVFPTGVLNGLIQDVRVYRVQLSAASLLQVMSEAKPGQGPDLQINSDWCGTDKQRPQYHAMPPRAWTNEPHGLVYFKDKYHLFYQKNGNGPYWGNINWGHMTSPDLHDWTEMPVALSPEHGSDQEGCWSGSVIVHDDKLSILYTAGGDRASICLATSSDGIRFEKHPGNPVIPGPPKEGGFPEFRDPFVWREGDGYYVIIGSAIKDVGGTALLYRSQDLVHWEFKKTLLAGDRETSGVFWEMPIFVKVGDMHVLIVCEVPGRASYWVGSWKDEVFTPVTAEPRRLELFNHLLSPTPYVTPKGEVITMGIIPDERSPKECWQAGWAHLYSLPRRLSVDAKGRLEQQPWEGLAKWESEPITLTNLKLKEHAPNPLNGASGACLHLRATIEKGTSRLVEVILRRSSDDRERTVLRYEWDIGRLVLDRTKSSLDPEVRRDLQEATYFPVRDNILDIEIYLDVSVVEVFLDRRAAFASRIYPTLDDSEGLAMSCFGGDASVASVTISRMPVRKLLDKFKSSIGVPPGQP